MTPDGETDRAVDSGDPTSGDESAPAGTGPRSTEARGLSGEDLSIFQSHWDDFAGHID